MRAGNNSCCLTGFTMPYAEWFRMNWASMLLRAYIRWAESRSFTVTVLSTDQEANMLKSGSLLIEGCVVTY